MTRRKDLSEIVPELYIDDDGEDNARFERAVSTRSANWQQVLDAKALLETDLVALYLFNMLSIDDRKAFEKKYSNNKRAMIQVNAMMGMIEEEGLVDYGEYVALAKNKFERPH